MTKEDKDLLLKDLCARLPYGVKVRVFDVKNGDFDSYVDNISNTCIETHPVEELTMDFNPYVFYKLQEIKPYLRPMSSITEKERFDYVASTKEERCIPELPIQPRAESTDWLNKHHFDYRGLLERGLAIEALEEMYEY